MEGPRVKIDMISEREIVIQGEERKRVPGITVEPGGTLIYTIKLVNESDSVATGVVVNNPVPKGADYVLGSATGDNSTALVSVDNGSTFAPESKVAGLMPAAVTNIRWMVDQMPAGSRRTVEFRVQADMQQPASLATIRSTICRRLVGMFSKITGIANGFRRNGFNAE